MKYILMMAVGLLMIGFTESGAQGAYPDTLWVPVTYYDFHSNGSNPEFEQNMDDIVRKGMVRDTLDSERKPILTTTASEINRNAYIKYWFRPWQDAFADDPSRAQGDQTYPTYQDNGDFNYGAYLGSATANHDTSFKNVVIQDSLPFLLDRSGAVPQGTYYYADNTFFPLDGRGFGNEQRNRNFSFTMELHWQFTMVEGLTFNFTGDDDVWAFIDGQLRMDLGGRHGPADGSFLLDTIPGLVVGQTYSLDFFFAERHTSGSNIRITSNIISAPPSQILLRADPPGDICAGDSIQLFATVIDANGDTIKDFDGEINWELSNGSANDNSHLYNRGSHGLSIRFKPTVAYTLDTLIAQLSTSGQPITASLVKHVTACHPESLWIEETVPGPNDTAALRNKVVWDQLVIHYDQLSGNAHAVLRDKYGNFVKASDSTRWTVTANPQNIDSVRVGSRAQGEGIVYKNSTLAAQADAIVRADGYDDEYGAMIPDDIRVVIEAIRYDSLMIAVRDPSNPGDYIRISSLTISTDNDTLLVVLGRRSDDNQRWDPVAGGWSINPQRLQPVIPPSSSTWDFGPADTGRGTITATYQTLNASIQVIATPGGPHHLILYSAANGIQYNGPAAETYVDSAGIEFPLYAKVFDSRGVQLLQYVDANAPVNWTSIELPGNRTPPTGSFTRVTTSGNQNGYLPTVANNVVLLISTFTGGPSFSDTVRVRVVPGKPHHVWIQADSLPTSTKLPQLQMTSSQTTALLYATLRDQYNNYISPVTASAWWSLDTSVVTAERSAGGAFNGEGTVTRISDLDTSTYVFASTADTSFKDSILISLSHISYDTLRIYTLDGGKRIIDTIRIRTDETKTLYVEGRRSDGNGWDNIPATWSISAGLKIVGNVPPPSDNWPVTPDSVGTGRIAVARSGAVGDSVVAIFEAGLPNQTRLYRLTGTPSAAQPYREPPLVDTLTAGVSAPFVAKIFDRNGVWLSAYENAAHNGKFTWTVSLFDGLNPPDTLSVRTGFRVAMMPTNAYNTYDVTVTFTEATRVYSATVRVYVKPGAVDHLVIEGNSNPTGTALRNDNPLNNIEFGNRDTIKTAFAVLRDRFGNFVSASKNTNWSSVNTSIVTAAEGLAVVGEGRVTRTGTLGSTKVVAVSRSNPAWFDSVDVELLQFSYDSLRIVVDDSLRIENLVMRSDEDTVLQVIGKRSFDGLWVPVNGDWVYTSNNGSQTAPSLMSWTFVPADTGSGIIVVSRGTAVPDTITVKINPGLPKKIELYAREGSVPDGTNPPYPDPLDTITAVAGTPFPLVAKVLDHRNVWLREYQDVPAKSREIKWSLIELPPTDSSGFLDDTSGHKRSFFPVRAYQSVYVVTELYIDGNTTLLDTVLLSITPGEPRQLVIEGSSIINRITPNPIDTAVIPSNTNTTRVYAILRDSIGNFVRYSTLTNWGVVNGDTAVSVRGGNANTGEGVVTRNVKDDTVMVFAVDQTTGFQDSTVVQLLSFYYTKLRIVVGNDTSAQSLTMVTTADTTLYAQGLRSDINVWVDIPAHWESKANLRITPQAPGWSQSWTFSPDSVGTGWIRLTIDDDAQTIPDTLPVTFLPGPPDKVVMKILTPEDKRIAGEPITIALEISNEDGLIPGEYCFDKDNGSMIIYRDTIGNGGRPRPYVLIGTDTLWLTEEGDRQCFTGGRDTITTTLFYVPDDPDSLHRISVVLGELTARTLPFRIRPAELDTLVLEYSNHQPVGDTIALAYPSGRATIFATGYDRYGNRIGWVISDWSADSTLHPISQATRTDRIIYSADNVHDNEAGTITAVTSDTALVRLSAHVFVKITGPLIVVTNARTRDVNGNGYLDQIVLTFSRPVSFPKDYNTEDLRVFYGITDFEIDSIIGMGTRTDSVWVVTLKENKDRNEPQTDWTPFISIAKNDAMTLDSTTELLSVDGAGPVIWTVVKSIEDVANRKTDKIQIVFSENVQRATGEGQSLSGSDSLTMLLYVWEAIPTSDSSFRYVLVDSMLYGINNIQSTGDDQLTFLVLNGLDIAPRHRISIKMIVVDGDTTAYITDRAESPNLPEFSNQKVPITIVGAKPIVMVAPNPSRPTARHTPPGELVLKHNPDAQRWVYQDGAGALIRIYITLPNVDTLMQRDASFNLDSVKLGAVMKIYDFVGNPVNSATAKNLLNDLPMDARRGKYSVFPIDSYWNMFNKNGLPVAPGIYRVVVRINANHPAYRRKDPYVITIGVRH